MQEPRTAAAAKVARAALDKEGLAKLGLSGSEPRSTAGLIQAGYTLFDNALGSGLLADQLSNRLATSMEPRPVA